MEKHNIRIPAVPLEGRKIRLRPIEDADAGDCVALLRDPRVSKTYLLPDYPTAEDAMPLFRRLRDLSRDEAHFVRALDKDGRMVGFFNDVSIADGVLEIGYVVSPACWNRGYATEGLGLAAAELFRLGLRELKAGFFEENGASRRVMEKNGLTPTGEEESLDYRGASHRVIYYARRRDVPSPEFIRQARDEDAERIAEILVFNYRLNFYPIFQSDGFYFRELTVAGEAERFRTFPDFPSGAYVYDDGAVKGFMLLSDGEIRRLFVEPCLQFRGIGGALLDSAVAQYGARTLWVLEKNPGAIRFYERHGFRLTEDRRREEDTEEFLVRMERTEA